jgi:hypothetical protein
MLMEIMPSMLADENPHIHASRAAHDSEAGECMQRIIHLGWAMAICPVLMLGAFSMSVFLVACGEPVPSATSLLQEAQTHFSAAHSFQFLFYVELEGSSAAPSSGLYVTRAQGVAQRPDRLSAAVDGSTPSGSIRGAQVVVIGAQGWLKHSPSSQYQSDDSILTFARFFDPHTGIDALLTQIEQPRPLDSNKDIWVTYGTIAADRLSGMLPGLAGKTDPVTIHVDISKRNHQLVGMNLEGALFSGESAHLSHIFSLSQFDIPVDIQPPAVASSSSAKGESPGRP